MFLRFLFVLTFSFLTSYSAAKDEPTSTTALTPIKMDHAPPSEAEFKTLFGPVKWARSDAEWGPGLVGEWFNAFGYFYRRDIVPKRDMLEKRSKALYRRLMAGEEVEAKIPAHLHRVWVTSNKAPHEAPEARIADYIHTMNELGEGFVSTFWCLDKTKIPKTVDVLEAHPRIEVREVKELWAEDIRGQAVFRRLFAGNYFALCSDIVRYKALYRHGGIYGDFGIQMKKTFAPLLAYDFLAVQKGFRFENALFAAKPKFKGLDRLLTFIDTVDFAAPPPLKQRFADQAHPVWIGTWAFTLNTELSLGPDDDVLYLQKIDDPYFLANHMASWLKPSSSNFGQAITRAPGYKPLKLFFHQGWTCLEEPVIKNWGQVDDRMFQDLVRFSQIFFKKGKPHLKAQRAASLEKTKIMFRGELKPPLNRIPHTNHQMWITKEKQIPQAHIAATIQRCRSLGEGWTHILWVMDETVLAPSIAKLKEGLPALEVRQVYDFYLRWGETSEEIPHKVKMYGQGIFDGLYEAGAFVSTTDVLRKNVLFRTGVEQGGGLYADMGIRFNLNITPLLDRADAAFYVNGESNLFDTGIMASAQGEKALGVYLDILDRIHTYKGPERNLADQLSIIAQRLWNCCYAQSCAEKVTLPLVVGKAISNAHLSSWRLNRGSLGNRTFSDVVARQSIYDMAAGQET